MGPVIADWAYTTLRAQLAGEAVVELVDLAEVNLPLYDEPMPAAAGNYEHEHTRRWAELVEKYDTMVFVTPEYNSLPPASLKNALDYLFAEWKGKRGAIISYGGHGGTRSAAVLTELLTRLGFDVVSPQVHVTIGRDDRDARMQLTQPEVTLARYRDDLSVLAAALVES